MVVLVLFLFHSCMLSAFLSRRGFFFRVCSPPDASVISDVIYMWRPQRRDGPVNFRGGFPVGWDVLLSPWGCVWRGYGVEVPHLLCHLS